MKRLRILAAAVLLWCLSSSCFYAAQEPVLITGVGNPINPASVKILFPSPQEDPAALALPNSYVCVVGRWAYNCPVEWDVSALDLSSPGLQAVPGTLLPEEGYAFAEGISSAVSWPVYVEGDGAAAVQLSQIIYEQPHSFVAALNAGPDALDLNLQTVYCLTENFGEYFSCALRWDVSAVDFAAAGVYTAVGTPDVPEAFLMPDGFTGVKVSIGVVRPDGIDLSAITDAGSGGFLVCEWIYKPEDRAGVSLEYSVNGGPWAPDPGNSNGGWRYGYYYRQYGNRLNLDLSALEPLADYAFRLVYDGDRYSNELHVRIDDENGVQTELQEGLSGDRDGGDLSGVELPDIEQPLPPVDSVSPSRPDDAPNEGSSGASASSGVSSSAASPSAALPSGVAPSGNAASSSSAQSEASGRQPQQSAASFSAAELVTGSSTTLSGARLRALLSESGNTVLFEKQGIAVEVPSDFLLGLGLEDYQLLKVVVEQPADGLFRLALFVDGAPLEELPGLTVRIPWKNSTEYLTCTDLDGVQISDAVYEAESGTVCCTVSAAGTYRITSASFVLSGNAAGISSGASAVASSDSAGTATPLRAAALWLLFPTAAALAGLVGLLLWRRRHG